MILFKISPVIPTDTLWLVMLLLIGIFGLMSQVWYFVASSSLADPDNLNLQRRFWSWVFNGRQLLVAFSLLIPRYVLYRSSFEVSQLF